MKGPDRAKSSAVRRVVMGEQTHKLLVLDFGVRLFSISSLNDDSRTGNFNAVTGKPAIIVVGCCI